MIYIRANLTYGSLMSQNNNYLALALQPLKKYADFSGRATRMEYWLFTLLSLLLIGTPMFFGIIILVIGEEMREDIIMGLGGIILCIGFLVILAMMIPMIAVAIRRLHDTNRSGWFYLLSIIPIINYIGSIVLLVFYCLDGDVGANQYGADPKGRGLTLDKDSVDALE
jgi:uncharacterized membrane protein YhaH (DUF805 family)